MIWKTRFQWSSEAWLVFKANLRRKIDPVSNSVLRVFFRYALGWLAEEHDLQVRASMNEFHNPTGTALDDEIVDLPMDPRKSGNYAHGGVTFEFLPNQVGTPITIDTSTTVQAAINGLLYKATKATTSDRTVIVDCQCTTIGEAGNVDPMTINRLVTQIAGIARVYNARQFTDGADAEDDVSLKARRNLFYDGLAKATPNALKNAVLSVPGVLYAEVREYYPTPGQATVAVCDRNGNASRELLTQVKDEIETGGSTNAPGYREASSTVNVVAPVRYLGLPTFRVRMQTGSRLVDYEAAILAAWRALCGQLGLGPEISLSGTGKAIAQAVPQIQSIETAIEVLQQPYYLPITIQSMTGGDWINDVSLFEWNYSNTSARWEGGSWKQMQPSGGGVFNPEVTFTSADGTRSLTTVVEPWAQGGSWPNYSYDEFISRYQLPELTRFERNEIVVAGAAIAVAMQPVSLAGVGA
jgi:hypothetical protein